jgi:hypothetical protein
MRDAVDAQAGVVEQADSSQIIVLCPATCARLDGVTTLTLRSMACLRRMLLVAPAAGVLFPRLQSLRLHMVRTHACVQSPLMTQPHSSLPLCMHARLICHASTMRACCGECLQLAMAAWARLPCMGAAASHAYGVGGARLAWPGLTCSHHRCC